MRIPCFLIIAILLVSCTPRVRVVPVIDGRPLDVMLDSCARDQSNTRMVCSVEEFKVGAAYCIDLLARAGRCEGDLDACINESLANLAGKQGELSVCTAEVGKWYRSPIFWLIVAGATAAAGYGVAKITP